MRKLFVSAVLLTALIAVSGCSTISRWYGYGDNDMASAACVPALSPSVLAPGEAWPSTAQKSGDRKVVHTATMTIEVKNSEDALSKISEMAKKYKGFILHSSLYSVKMKVEAGLLKDAVSEIEKLGKLRAKDIEGTDVTDEYYDLKIRIETAANVRDRYLELLKKAENVETALQVETELERVNRELELLKGKQQRLSNQIDYSTITVNVIQEREEVKVKREVPGPLGLVFWGLYKTVECLFVIRY